MKGIPATCSDPLGPLSSFEIVSIFRPPGFRRVRGFAVCVAQGCGRELNSLGLDFFKAVSSNGLRQRSTDTIGSIENLHMIMTSFDYVDLSFDL